MTRFSSRSIALRRLLPAAVLVATTILLGGAVADPAAASAKDGEWDVGEYDLCMKIKEMDRNDPTVPYQPLDEATSICCWRSGGHYDGSTGPNGTCSAPPAIAAGAPVVPPPEAANPDVSAGSTPPTKAGPKPLTPKFP